MGGPVLIPRTSLRTRPADLNLPVSFLASLQEPGDVGSTAPAAIEADLGASAFHQGAGIVFPASRVGFPCQRSLLAE